MTEADGITQNKKRSRTSGEALVRFITILTGVCSGAAKLTDRLP